VETPVLRTLLAAGTLVLCAGGGVPVVRDERTGRLRGVEAVVDKDLTAALLAEALGMDALLLLTDIRPSWRSSAHRRSGRAISVATPVPLRALRFPEGAIGPKVDAACRFVERTGGSAAIGTLHTARRCSAARPERSSGRPGTTPSR
jgi:carbamate kinase